MRFLFVKPCPRCSKSWNDSWCMECAHPKSGENRGWVWRWEKLHYRWVVSLNAHKQVEVLRLINRIRRAKTGGEVRELVCSTSPIGPLRFRIEPQLLKYLEVCNSLGDAGVYRAIQRDLGCS